MEFLAGPFGILAIALAIWFLSGKDTRKSVGNGIKSHAKNFEHSAGAAGAQMQKEMEEELGQDEALELLKRRNAFLAEARKQ